ncbi:unnamed protein product [Merluccius merluccius]
MEKMSSRHLASLTPSFLPAATHGVLKSLLENPMKLPLHHEVYSKEQEKEKALEEEERNVPQSAFLGPTLWDKTLPYDGDNFQLEYMDLEEFLSENGIPSSPAHHHQHHHHHHHQHHDDQHQSQAPQHQQIQMSPATPAATPSPSVMDLSNHAATITATHTCTMASPNCMHGSPVRAGLTSSRNTPSPIDLDSIHVPVGYDPDPADLALSSVPGQEMFDPRKRKFTAEELKPQPMIKKARKVYIPEDCKVVWSWPQEKEVAFLKAALGKETPFLMTPLLPVLSSTPRSAVGEATTSASAMTSPSSAEPASSCSSSSQGGVSIRKRRRLAANPGGLRWDAGGSVLRDFGALELSPVSGPGANGGTGRAVAAGGGGGSRNRVRGGGGGGATTTTTSSAAAAAAAVNARPEDHAALRKAVSIDDRLLRPAGWELQQTGLLGHLERGRNKLRNIHPVVECCHLHLTSRRPCYE